MDDLILRLPPDSPLGAAITEKEQLIPLRVPPGWHIIHNQLYAWRLPGGEIEMLDSEDLFWARTAPPPWLSAEEVAKGGGLRARQITIDAGWYRTLFRIVVLDPDWDHQVASYETSDLEDFASVLGEWMQLITFKGKIPG